MVSSARCRTHGDSTQGLGRIDEGARAVSQHGDHGTVQAGGASFTTRWATTPAEVASAQRLRFQVFAGELGARLPASAKRLPGHDVDEFDALCRHLLVLSNRQDGAPEVLATCRILLPDAARRLGRRYSDAEFDLSPLRDLLPGAAEMGRVCVAPAWRNGLLILALWRELGQMMAREGLDTLIGCSSVGLADGGVLAAQLWRELQANHLVEPARQVRPRRPLPLRADTASAPVPVPPLIKGYLRCGGRLLGPPALDAAFRTADFPMMLRLGDLPSRYGKRLLCSA